MSSYNNVIHIYSWKVQWGIEIQCYGFQITLEGRLGERKQPVTTVQFHGNA